MTQDIEGKTEKAITMKKYIIKLFAILFAIGLLATSATTSLVQAAEPKPMPNYYPKTFQVSGTVSKKTTGEIHVSGTRFKFKGGTKIHSPASRYSSIHSVKEGSEVGISYTTDKDGNATITEIWILPTGTFPQM